MGLCLLFLPNFPGATFIQGTTLLQTLEYVLIFVSVSLMRENLRGLREKLKPKIRTLGSEAVEWGHGDTMVFTGSEENMLVASICDLCER